MSEGAPRLESDRSGELDDHELRLYELVARNGLLSREELAEVVSSRAPETGLLGALLACELVDPARLKELLRAEGIVDGDGPGKTALLGAPRSGPPGPVHAGKGREHPETIGPYRILEVLGEGGMGVVYKGYDAYLDRTLAIKVLDLTGGGLQRFEREAKLCAQLNHPYVVKVYGFQKLEGFAYLAMDFIEGTDLYSQLVQGTLTPRAAATLVAKAGRGVHHAHEMGIIHRDLKPANILVDARGDPRVVDFGLALPMTEERLTQTGMTVGTPYFMAPEQFANADITRQTDVYALGVILYLVVTGEFPYRPGQDLSMAWQVIETDARPMGHIDPSIPKDLEAIVFKAMEKKPEARYATADDLAGDLENFLAGMPVSARRLGTLRLALRRLRRHWRIVLPTVVLFAGILVLSVYHVMQRLADEARAARLSHEKAEIAQERAREALEKERIARVAEARERKLRLEVEKMARRNQSLELVQRATELYRARGDLAAIRALLDVIDKVLPGYPRALRLEGRIALDRRQWTKARSFLERALAGDPEDYETHLLLFRWHYDQGLGNSRGAERHVLAVARYKTDDAIGWWARARSLWQGSRQLAPEAKKRRLEEAIGLCDRCLKKRGDFAWALVVRAMCKQDLGDFDGALADHDRVVQLTRTASAYLQRALLQRLRKRTHDALDDLSQAIRIYPAFVEAYRQRALLHVELEDNDKALGDLSAALGHDPASAILLADRGRVHEKTGRDDRALADYTQAHRLAPRNAAILVRRGDLLARLRRAREALADYTNAVRLDPASPDAYLRRSLLFESAGERRHALRDLTDAVRIAPGHAPTRLRRANLLVALGDSRAALDDYDAAIKVNPWVAAWYHLRGRARHAAGRPRQAIADYSEAIRMEEKLTAAYVDRGRSYFQLDRFAEAAADWRKALESTADPAARARLDRDIRKASERRSGS